MIAIGTCSTGCYSSRKITALRLIGPFSVIWALLTVGPGEKGFREKLAGMEEEGSIPSITARSASHANADVALARYKKILK